jgi:hypothetical protein
MRPCRRACADRMYRSGNFAASSDTSVRTIAWALSHAQRRFNDRLPLHAGVEIDHDAVAVFEIFHQRIPRMQFDRRRSPPVPKTI